VLFFMRDWTRLLLLNSQIFMVIVGGCVAMVGLSAAAFARARSDWMKAVPHLMRTLFALLGIAIVAAGGMAAIKDIALPRLVVEGRVDSVDAYRKRLVDTDYFVVIDGKRFQSTFEAFVHIHPARQVRVEVGAGSGVILAAGDNERRAISRPGRN